MVTCPRVTGSSVSGMRILLIAIDAGILMTDEVTRLVAGTPRLIYAASTEPAIVENPDVIVKSANTCQMHWSECKLKGHERNSDSVMTLLHCQ